MIQTKPKINTYYFYYVVNSTLKEVSKVTFKKCDYKCVSFSGVKIKIVQGTALKSHKEIMSVLKKQNFKAQGLRDYISSLIDGVRTILDSISFLGNLSRGSSSVDMLFVAELGAYILNMLRLLMDRNTTIPELINVMFSTYIILTKIKRGKTIFTDENGNAFQAQGLDTLGVAALSMLLPEKLFKLITRMNQLGSGKIMDDVTIFHSILVNIHSFVELIMEYMAVSDQTKLYINKILSFVGFSKKHVLVQRMRVLNEKFIKDEKLYLSRPLLKECRELLSQINVCDDLHDWERISKAVADIVKRFKDNVKIIENNCSSSRKEPVCFVFEGSAGCGKSRSMTSLIQFMNKNCYSHCTKSVVDNKDWYDSYNNEEVFYMDDVGQMGVSQWRSIINMVSPVRMPLDCAAAEKKDYKFFNSEILLLTTNNLQNIQLMQNDCISHKEALFRRCNLFEFNTKVDSSSGLMSGEVLFKYFDISTQSYVQKFPTQIKNFLKSKNLNIPDKFCFEDGVDAFAKFIAWLSDIVGISQYINQQRFISNEVGDDVRAKIEGYTLFKGQSINEEQFFDPAPLINFQVRDINDYSLGEDYWSKIFKVTKIDVCWISELITNYIREIVTKMVDHIKHLVVCVQSKAKNTLTVLKEFFKTHWVILSIGIVCLVAWETFKGKTLEISGISHLDLEDQDLIFEAQVLPTNFISEKNVHTSYEKISKQVYPLEIVYTNRERAQCYGLVSGHCIVVPAHVLLEDDLRISVFADLKKVSLILDNKSVTVVYRNNEADIGIVSIGKNYPTPWSNLAHFIKLNESGIASRPKLVCQERYADLGGMKVNSTYTSFYNFMVHGVGSFRGKFSKDSYFYGLSASGLCGIPIVDQDLGILGMHVAGSDKINVGVASKLSNSVKKDIKEILLRDTQFYLPCDINLKQDEGLSVLKLNDRAGSSVPKDTDIVASPLHGIYPITRFPANLSKEGPGTVKTIAKKSFQVLPVVDMNEVKFGVSLVKAILEPFGTLSEREIIEGTPLLAGLNRISSNGYKCLPDKCDYIDFGKCEFKPFFRHELEILENSIKDGSFSDWDKFRWCETLKDELRSVSKEGTPRSFRVGTIHCQVLTKKYFGKMVEHILANRDLNKIMIGCNPIRDWDKMYRSLERKEIVFDGDIGSFDGGMLVQVQEQLTELLSNLGMDKENNCIRKFILDNMSHSLLTVMNTSYVTTHSMPSGSFLTAIMNSLVNRVYAGMWFHRNVSKGSINDFYSKVDNYVYGDDIVVGVSKEFVSALNALTMGKFFESIGLSFTDGNKKPIKNESVPLNEIVFLKRKFSFHPKLGRIVCPLSLDTLYSGLSWFDQKKICDVVMEGKISTFQREIYLHPEWKELLNLFKTRMANYEYPFVELPEQYLLSLYEDENCVLEDYSNKYS